MTDKKSIFIIRACEVHGINKYDYSQIKYVNLNTKIEIICKFNHVFEQIPSVHLRGFGCPKCSGKHKKTTDEFIIEARKIHFDYYDYSMVLYKNSSSKVNIICKKHGLFEQNTKNHLNGNGCPKCFGNIKKTSKEFIIEAQKIHFDHYDYSMVLYKNSSSNVNIICKKHGLFEQTPTTHLSGHGCTICGNLTIGIKLRNTIEHFIKKSQEVHGIDKYDYSKVLYIRNKIKISIICNEHGLFEQIPLNHVKGHGCPKCVFKKQYSKSSINWLNFIQLKYNIEIQHGENIGEFKIPNTNFKADGYCKENNTIYEFHGDYWHGNPKIYIDNEINQTSNHTFGELYQRTLDREQQIRDLGYNLITIWENDWKKINRCVKILQRKYRKSKLR